MFDKGERYVLFSSRGHKLSFAVTILNVKAFWWF